MFNQGLFLSLFFSVLVFFCCSAKNGNDDKIASSTNNTLDAVLTPISTIEAAYANHESDISVTVKGNVVSILSDDTVGGRHQRFIIQMSNQQTLLISHNIDIAPHVSGLKAGSLVYAHGDYVWNDQGGLIHWTHHDPDGLHENGWIVLGETKYQ